MIARHLLKPGFTSILFTLFMALQMSACSLEKNSEDITDSTNDSGNEASIDINSAAVISGVDSGSVTEDVDPDNDNLLEVGGKLDITDSDVGEAFFIEASSMGVYGNLTIDTMGDWSYVADNSQAGIQDLISGVTVTDSFTVSSVDGTTYTVVITIMGADEGFSLSWAAPVEREDNSPILLSEIAGYRVYYGTTQSQYPNSFTINDGTAEGYVFTDFSTGTYYFVVTTLDTDGRESKRSAEVTVVL